MELALRRLICFGTRLKLASSKLSRQYFSPEHFLILPWNPLIPVTMRIYDFEALDEISICMLQLFLLSNIHLFNFLTYHHLARLQLCSQGERECMYQKMARVFIKEDVYISHLQTDCTAPPILVIGACQATSETAAVYPRSTLAY